MNHHRGGGRYSAVVSRDEPPPTPFSGSARRRRHWAFHVVPLITTTFMLALAVVFGLSLVFGFTTSTATGEVAATGEAGRFEARFVTDHGLQCSVRLPPSDPPPGLTVTVRYPPWFPCLNARVESDRWWWVSDVVALAIASFCLVPVIILWRRPEAIVDRRRDPTRRFIGRRPGARR